MGLDLPPNVGRTVARRPGVTVLVPTRADDPFLLEALNSVLTQTRPPERVIAIASADDEGLTELEHRLARLSTHLSLEIASQPGMIGALNHGLAVAGSEFVAFLDSDDLWLPEKQARQVALLEEDVSLHAVCGLAANFTAGSPGERTQQPALSTRLFTATTFRATAFDLVGGLDPEAGHYTWLYRWWTRAQRIGLSVGSVDLLCTLRRIHATNSWRTGNADAVRALFSELRRSGEA